MFRLLSGTCARQMPSFIPDTRRAETSTASSVDPWLTYHGFFFDHWQRTHARFHTAPTSSDFHKKFTERTGPDRVSSNWLWNPDRTWSTFSGTPKSRPDSTRVSFIFPIRQYWDVAKLLFPVESILSPVASVCSSLPVEHGVSRILLTRRSIHFSVVNELRSSLKKRR